MKVDFENSVPAPPSGGLSDGDSFRLDIIDLLSHLDVGQSAVVTDTEGKEPNIHGWKPKITPIIKVYDLIKGTSHVMAFVPWDDWDDRYKQIQIWRVK
uniref:Uncharacterized protein n=1 Tax=viral metagenome TaxID=1070528 RepID=A0A6M3X4S0_9ZZZZ